MLLAATLVIVLPQLLQNRNSALIVQVGAAGAAEQQAELSLVGWLGVVSGNVYERESAASVDTTEGRNPNQQKPHFELDGVRVPAAG